MRRLLIVGATIVGLAVALLILRREPEQRPWKTTDEWYRTSDVALLGSTGRPQLVEFFHPD